MNRDIDMETVAKEQKEKICHYCRNYPIIIDYKDHMETHILELEYEKRKAELDSLKNECYICGKVYGNIIEHLKIHQYKEQIRRLKKRWWQIWK